MDHFPSQPALNRPRFGWSRPASLSKIRGGYIQCIFFILVFLKTIFINKPQENLFNNGKMCHGGQEGATIAGALGSQLISVNFLILD
jgi:hypothetical protein